MEVREASVAYDVLAAEAEEVPVGYKRTEMGVIPEDWVIKSLEGIAPLQRGFDLPNRLRRDGGYPVVYSNGILTTHAEYMARGPGVVTGRSGTLGKVHYVANDYWPHNTSLWVTSFKDNIPKFVYHLYKNIGLERFASGSGVPTLNRNDVHAFRVAVPASQCEQKAIADALSDADALIESLEQLLVKKRQIKQGTMQELLTGEKRLPGFSGEWRVKLLGDIANIKTGSRNNKDKMEDGEYPFFVRSTTVERISSYSHDCEAILIPGEGGIGSIFHYINGRFDVHQRVYAITQFSADVSGQYVYLYMTEHFGAHAMENSVKATVDSLRLPTFQAFDVLLPPTIDEQAAIATVLNDMGAEILALETRLGKTHEIKQGMMQELLTGRIRLVQPVSSVAPLPKSAKASAVGASGHNRTINEAVVIAKLTQLFGSDEWPLARVRRTKLAYLLHRHVEGRADGFLKKAAGPYDPTIRYRGPESVALKNGYVRAHNNGTYEGFVVADNMAQAETYFEKWYGTDAAAWLEQFQWKKTDELELLATVDMAMEDLRREGKQADLETVKRLISNHPEWKPKLDKAYFSDDHIVQAMSECHALFGD